MRAANPDVLVIGAGPAGSTVARQLAARGVSVLLLDRARFPRPKACAGGLPASVTGLLPFDLNSGIGAPITTACLSYRVSDERVYVSDRPLGWTVDRKRFDLLLVEEAVAAGARFEDGSRVERLRPLPEGWEIEARGRTLRTRFIVGADGAAGVTARAARVPRPPLAVTIEASVHVPAERWREVRGRVRFDFGCVASGYAWVFAKSDHFSAGIYSARPLSGRALRRILESFIPLDPWLSGGTVSSIRRWVVPRAPARSRRLHFRGGLLVGDAAGLADPLTGEGIRPALHSAHLAVEALMEALDSRRPDLQRYSHSVDRGLQPGFRAARVWAAVAFRGHGRLVGGFVRSRFGEKAWARLTSGQVSGPSVRWGLAALVSSLRAGGGSRRTRDHGR